MVISIGRRVAPAVLGELPGLGPRGREISAEVHAHGGVDQAANAIEAFGVDAGGAAT
ncbi:hypothetical protein HQO42_17675 [Rhodococcus fascians]|nr:hypothetical protein [Rhodococcus fascians]MBY4238562.1 hypothetical protein [Rhodococcus fascians]MBY4254489.1 hypothetical protein [Rhodococcus fascians]MBY4269917.1 hypothetical protein [Rhodococcus fascians]